MDDSMALRNLMTISFPSQQNRAYSAKYVQNQRNGRIGGKEQINEKEQIDGKKQLKYTNSMEEGEICAKSEKVTARK